MFVSVAAVDPASVESLAVVRGTTVSVVLSNPVCVFITVVFCGVAEESVLVPDIVELCVPSDVSVTVVDSISVANSVELCSSVVLCISEYVSVAVLDRGVVGKSLLVAATVGV